MNFLLEDLNTQVVAARHALDEFSRPANGRNSVPETLILETMVRDGSCLFSLKFVNASLEDIMRLTCLALTCSIFLKWYHTKKRYSSLATTYKEGVDNMMLYDGRVSDAGILWMLMAGQLCICHE